MLVGFHFNNGCVVVWENWDECEVITIEKVKGFGGLCVDMNIGISFFFS